MNGDFVEQVRSTPRGEEFTRDVPFESAMQSDGRTLEGYAAVFDHVARIRDLDGEFDEVIRRGAFVDSLRERWPVVMFEHGKHPLIGSMPLGELTRAEEDSKGLHVEARLSENWLIRPVVDAIRDHGVRGMSFRMRIPEGGDRWSRGNQFCEVNRIQCRELGPVVFPAYDVTSVAVRAALDRLESNAGAPDARSTGRGDSSRAEPGNGDAQPSPLDEQARARDDVFRNLRWTKRRILSVR